MPEYTKETHIQLIHQLGNTITVAQRLVQRIGEITEVFDEHGQSGEHAVFKEDGGKSTVITRPPFKAHKDDDGNDAKPPECKPIVSDDICDCVADFKTLVDALNGVISAHEKFTHLQ